MKTVWIEIFFDVEDVSSPSQIGINLKDHWVVVVWKLDKNNEPIIDSSIKKASGLSLASAKMLSNEIKRIYRKKGWGCIVSNPNPDSRYPIKTIQYELLGYEKTRLNLENE